MLTIIRPTTPEDLHQLTVSKDEEETFIAVDLRRNPRLPIHADMRVHPITFRMTWVEAVLLRNAMDELINDKD